MGASDSTALRRRAHRLAWTALLALLVWPISACSRERATPIASDRSAAPATSACSCDGRQCGLDGCGSSCGACKGERLCTQDGACTAAPYPATGYEIGVAYHATGPDFERTAFLTRYHEPSVRSLVRAQLGGMAEAGITLVSTKIWHVLGPGMDAPESWKHHFPLTKRETQNVRAYAEDVAAAGLKLYLSFGYLWCAGYSEGSPSTTFGQCGVGASAFVARVKGSIGGVLEAVRDVYLPDGRPVVERVFLDGELRTAADATDPATAQENKNQRWFLKDSGLWSWFWAETRSAGLIPSLYFIQTPTEAEVLDDAFEDKRFAELSGHRSMYWMYRTLRFLEHSRLPLPDRIDFSAYPTPKTAGYDVLLDRMLADFAATVPKLLGGPRDAFIAETHYFPDAGAREKAQRALAAALAKHPELRGAVFWTTPDGGGKGMNVGYPFDVGPLKAGRTSKGQDAP